MISSEDGSNPSRAGFRRSESRPLAVSPFSLASLFFLKLVWSLSAGCCSKINYPISNALTLKSTLLRVQGGVVNNTKKRGNEGTQKQGVRFSALGFFDKKQI